MTNLFNKIFKKELCSEVIDAYWNKLPDSISVRWFRDGKFIIGEVEADGYKFMTQGTNAEEFIEMVNDALLAVYEIPKDYVDFFCKIRRYEPSREQKSVLMNRNISKAEFGVKKMELAKC